MERGRRWLTIVARGLRSVHGAPVVGLFCAECSRKSILEHALERYYIVGSFVFLSFPD